MHSREEIVDRRPVRRCIEEQDAPDGVVIRRDVVLQAFDREEDRTVRQLFIGILDLDQNVSEMVEGVRNHVGRVVVLTGPAGCGKTTVALAAARQLADRHRTFWVAAHHRTSFVEGMAAVARELGESDVEIARAREETSPTLVWRLLTVRATADDDRAGVLLVIDNVDDPELATDVVRQARALLPPGWRIVITTRVRPGLPASNLAAVVEVGRLSVEAGADLVLDRIPEMDRARRRRELPYAREAAEAHAPGHVPLRR